MVNFNLDSKDSNKYLKHLIFISCKKIIIIEIICFLLSTFFILVGIFDDKEALMYGFGLIMIDIILVLLTIVGGYFAHQHWGSWPLTIAIAFAIMMILRNMTLFLLPLCI